MKMEVLDRISSKDLAGKSVISVTGKAPKERRQAEAFSPCSGSPREPDRCAKSRVK